uniref:MATE family efflux transporter n=1 Tax=Prevotella sp. GTC17254 TaxID=3236794 RepID=A0AB33IZM6_9BACT
MKPIDSRILQLAIPSIISNITAPLLGMVDLAIVGHLGDVALIGAIAVGAMIFNVVYWLLGFLRMGTSGMTSQALGRRDFGEVMTLWLSSLVVGVGLGCLLILLQWPIGHLALVAIQPSDAIWQFVETYFRICIWGAPAMLGLYGLTGWYIGMQNTRVPMLVSVFQNVVNIVASLTLAIGMDMKLEGVALGTLTAQWSGFLLSLLIWLMRYGRLSRYMTGVRLTGNFFTVNRDLFLRTVFLVSVNLFFVSAGARSGDVVLSANTLLMTLYTLFSYIMDGFAFAGEALGGKSFGQRDRAGFDELCRRLAFWGGGMVVLFTLLYMVGGHLLLSLLTSDVSVLAVTDSYLGWALLIPAAGVGAFILDGIFVGLTATRGMIASSFLSTVLFLAVYFAGMGVWSNHALWLAFILYLMNRGIVEYIWLKKINRVIWK